ncbi:MAG: FxLYD domain-containing protein, partial [Dongiaceae bacterium]
PILTVQGVVVNVSNAVQPVPRLVATVKDLQGQELDSWSFAAEVTHLPPGGSTGFRTETVYPTATTQSTNVSVTFVGAGSQS